MQTVVITGVAGALGRRLVANVAAAPNVDRVLAVDLAAPPGAAPVDPPVVSLAGNAATVQHRVVSLDEAPLEELLDEGAALIHLGAAALDEAPVEDDELRTVRGVGRLLDAVAKSSVPQLVIVSSATVYGAWPTNPVPLTEQAPLRPNPDFGPAVALAEVERLVREWRDEHPSVAVAVLRAATTVAPDRPGWLARSLRAALDFPVDGRDPATQFLHLDDLVGAVGLALRQRLDGVFNVAPDGWIEADDRRALDLRPRFHLPERWAAMVASVRWQLGTVPAPPEVLPYATHPWVVANGSLRAAGWRPAHTNEEAWVDAHPGGPLATLSPRRRQELILGGVAAAGVGAATAGAAFLRRKRR